MSGFNQLVIGNHGKNKKRANFSKFSPKSVVIRMKAVTLRVLTRVKTSHVQIKKGKNMKQIKNRQ